MHSSDDVVADFAPEPEPPVSVPAEPAADAPTQPDAVHRLERLLASHLAEMRGLSRDALSRAHAEIDRQRDDAGLGSLRPLLNEILTVHDDLSRLIGHYASASAADPKHVAANLDGLRTELEELLARRGVVPLSPLPDRFDRETQRAVRVLPAEGPAEDLFVVQQVRVGFHGPAGVVRRADVAVLRFHAPNPTAVPLNTGA